MPVPPGRQNSLKNKLKRVKSIEWQRRPEVLLCENIPKPLHGVAPRVVLGQSWWNEERQKAYASTAYHCLACGVHKSKAKGPKHLEGHELYDINYAQGLMTYVETVPLCNYCHNFIHDGRLRALLDKGEITFQRYCAVIQHGESVLSEYNIVKASHKERDDVIKLMMAMKKIAKWSDWRLVINGEKYPPRFKNLKEWEKHHG